MNRLAVKDANLFAAKICGELFCKRHIVYEIRSGEEFIAGVTDSKQKGGVLNLVVNKLAASYYVCQY
jgi:hypothetical protein